MGAPSIPGSSAGPRSRAAAIWALLGLQLLLVLPLAHALNLWVDEIYSLHTAAQGPLDALSRGIHFERQAPLYFGLLALWREVDPSPFFARLLSILCIGLSLFVVARIGRRLFPDVHPAWFAAPLALHPTAIWAALEIRVYALAILLGGLVLGAGLRAFFARERARGAWLAFVAASAVSLYTQYYLGFVVAALGVALLATRRTRELWRYALALVAIALLCAPIALWLPEQTAGYGASPERLGLLGAIRFFATILADELVPAHRLTHGIDSETLRWLARGLLFAVFAAALLRLRVLSRLAQAPAALAVSIVVVVVALQFSAVGLLIGSHLVEAPKYWSYLCLPATIALVSAIAALQRPQLLRVVVALLLAADAAELLSTYRALAKPTDMERVAELLMREEHPGEPILVFPSEWALTLRHYYRGVNPIVPVPHEPSLDRWNPQDLGVQSDAQVRAMLAALPGDSGVVWLVKDDEIARGREILERAIERDFSVEETRTFYRENRVERLQRREPAPSR